MNRQRINRRHLLALGGGALAGSLLGRLAMADQHEEAHGAHGEQADSGNTDVDLNSNRWALPKRQKVRLAVNLNAVCIAPVSVAATQGIFERHNLDVEFVNFGNSTDVLLESMATGKADAAVGMALRWLKALEQGFDVKLTAGTHGGCMRLLTLTDGPKSLEALKGAKIGVSDMAGADKNFFSLIFKRHGVDPVSDITWKVYPQDVLGVALQKGEIQAASGSDPLFYRLKEQPEFAELATNMVDDYAKLSCCVVGVGGTLARNDTAAAAAITHSILQAHAWGAAHPEQVADAFIKQALNTSKKEIAAVLRSQTHGHHCTGQALVSEIEVYARDLKSIGVLRPRTDPREFAEAVHADVFV